MHFLSLMISAGAESTSYVVVVEQFECFNFML